MPSSFSRPPLRLRTVLVLFVAAPLAACAAAGPRVMRPDIAPRPAVDAPAAFTLDAQGSRPVVTNGACRSPIFDPRTGASYALVSSSGGVGDYAVPDGRYGAHPDELLRVRCADGRPLGLVRR